MNQEENIFQDEQRKRIYKEIVQDPTDFTQISRFHTYLKGYNIAEDPIKSFEQIKKRVELKDRVGLAENLTRSLIEWLQNTFPQPAIESFPSDWQQDIAEFFLKSLLSVSATASSDELHLALGIEPTRASYARIIIPGALSRDVLSDLLNHIFQITRREDEGSIFKYNPTPVTDRKAFEEMFAARQKLDSLQQQMREAVNVWMQKDGGKIRVLIAQIVKERGEKNWPGAMEEIKRKVRKMLGIEGLSEDVLHSCLVLFDDITERIPLNKEVEPLIQKQAEQFMERSRENGSIKYTSLDNLARELLTDLQSLLSEEQSQVLFVSQLKKIITQNMTTDEKFFRRL